MADTAYSRKNRIASLAVWLLILLYIGLFAWQSIARHQAFATNAYDMGNVNQAFWNTVYGRPLQFTNWRGVERDLANDSRLAMHVEPIYFVLAPIYGLWQRPETILLLQTIILALGALPVFWLARDRLDSPAAGVVFAAVYLLFPGLEAANMWEFHAVALAAPLLLFAFYLKQQFTVTGVDLSSAMLAQAKELNPECMFVQGDMRTFRLDRTFDAVLMDDALSHMSCLADFAAAFRTVYAHLNPGGVLVATPDVTTETFQQNKTIVTPAAPRATQAGVEVVFVENTYDPDPTDVQYETTVLYLIRDHGRLRIETDHWTMGIFSPDTWRRVLREAGFEVHEGQYSAGEDDYIVFTCVKTS